MTMDSFAVSSDSGRAPGREHLVWHNYLGPDGTSRSRVVAQTSDRAHADRIAEALRHPTPSTNFRAVLAAVHARGPRCDRCGNWTFRPEYLFLQRFVARLCPTCLPQPDDLMRDGWRVFALTQVFKSDLSRYRSGEVIKP